jgi:hypothetical protein
MFADDTSILVSHNNVDDFENVFNHVLLYISKWFQANHLKLNVQITNITKFSPTKFLCSQLNLAHGGNFLVELDILKFLIYILTTTSHGVHTQNCCFVKLALPALLLEDYLVY